ncbi:MAG TPA: extracellular solute-binding protein [Pirellulales bacterium]|nr:extracellular solute-binding protein [Pirellulales bacterium]
MRPLTTSRVYRLALTAVLAFVVGGCSADKQPDSADAVTALPFEGVELKLVVADDAELAEAIGRLRGEWRGSTGSELDVSQIAENELLDADSLDADAVIYPAYDLGLLVERDWLAPLPKSVSTSGDLASGDVFEADKAHDASWGSTAYGVSFGSPVLVCMYRADLLRQLDRQPPRTWQEYQDLAALLADGEKLGVSGEAVQTWSGAIEPLASDWAGLTLLARAAAYAKHRNHYSALFDIETMSPLIAGPPFVRALDELGAASRLSADSLRADPAGVCEAFFEGRCGLALTWPAARSAQERAGERDGNAQPGQWEVGFIELPGSSDVYNPKIRAWEMRRADEPQHVPLLGISGRIGSVSKSSEHDDATWRLLAWLSGPKWGDRVATASRATTVYRRSQIDAGPQWGDARLGDAAATEYVEVVERSLSAVEVLGAPRLRGRRQYLKALDEAVERTLRGEASSQEALQSAAAAWTQITDELGREQQRAAYRRSLGLP